MIIYKELPKRRPNRLKGYDYSGNGTYFITICVKDKHEMLWNVGATFGRPSAVHPVNDCESINNFDSTLHLSEYGLIIDKEMNCIDKIYGNNVIINKYVIMPNHIHMIISLNNCQEDNNGRPKVAPTISRIIQQFKGSVTKQIGFSLWQKLFHDHIIKDEKEYQKICQYIETNPFRLEEDCFYIKENDQHTGGENKQ